jgi:hypothetical protein
MQCNSKLFFLSLRKAPVFWWHKKCSEHHWLKRPILSPDISRVSFLFGLAFLLLVLLCYQAFLLFLPLTVMDNARKPSIAFCHSLILILLFTFLTKAVQGEIGIWPKRSLSVVKATEEKPIPPKEEAKR